MSSILAKFNISIIGFEQISSKNKFKAAECSNITLSYYFGYLNKLIWLIFNILLESAFIKRLENTNY